MKNITWPAKLHWRTQLFINKHPVLRHSHLMLIGVQDELLREEVYRIDELEKYKGTDYYRLRHSNYVYQKELLQAIAQLEELEWNKYRIRDGTYTR